MDIFFFKTTEEKVPSEERQGQMAIFFFKSHPRKATFTAWPSFLRSWGGGLREARRTLQEPAAGGGSQGFVQRSKPHSRTRIQAIWVLQIKELKQLQVLVFWSLLTRGHSGKSVLSHGPVGNL